MTITMINSSANKNIGYIKTISLIIAFVFLFENTGHSFLYASQNKTNLRIPLASSIGKDKERLKRILLLAGKSVSPVRPADEYRFNVAAIAEPVSIWQPWTAILLMGVLGTQRPVQKMMLTASSSVVQQARREIYHENINESSYEVHVDY